MPLSVEELRDHFAYSAWASQRLVQAASELTEAELLRDFQTSEHSVLGTLVHTFAGDRVWLARLRQSPRLQYSSEADYRLSVLQNDWPDLYRQWDELLASVLIPFILFYAARAITTSPSYRMSGPRCTASGTSAWRK